MMQRDNCIVCGDARAANGRVRPRSRGELIIDIEVSQYHL